MLSDYERNAGLRRGRGMVAKTQEERENDSVRIVQILLGVVLVVVVGALSGLAAVALTENGPGTTGTIGRTSEDRP